MAKVVVSGHGLVDKPNGAKKMELRVDLSFTVECPCKDVTVNVYWHSASSGASITDPTGKVTPGVSDNPQGVPWKWTRGKDGWITDSVDTDPKSKSAKCFSQANGNLVRWADKPGLIIPAGSLGAGYKYQFEFYWKVDVLCKGQVIDQEFYRVTLTGKGSATGPQLDQWKGAQGQAALAEVNAKMKKDKTKYPVDAEGRPWPP